MRGFSRRLIFFSIMLLAAAATSEAEETDERQRLEAFFSSNRYDVTCLDIVADPRTTKIAERLQVWCNENQDRFRKLVEENPGGPLPYQEQTGISREDWEWYGEHGRHSLRFQQVGERMSYSVNRDGANIHFRLIDTDGIERRLVPKTIPFGVNLMLTNILVNLEDTTLRLFSIDAGRAEWATGESVPLGPWRGFGWKRFDERLLELEQIPEGETAARVQVCMYYSSTEKRVYGECKLTLGTNKRITANIESRFWMTGGK